MREMERYTGKDGIFCKLSKKLLRLIISNIGLSFIIVGYTLLGAFTYQHVEGKTKLPKKLNLTEIRAKHREVLWEATAFLNTLNESGWRKIMQKELKEFQSKIYEKAIQDESPQWSFAKSLLFSVATVTTIGYGDIYPTTSLGRIFTMFYAAIGIPLMMISLVNTGQLLAGCFRFLYRSIQRMRRHGFKRCGCGRCCCSREEIRDNPSVVDSQQADVCVHLRSGMVSEAEILEFPEEEKLEIPGLVCPLIMGIYVIMGAILFSHWEKWDYFEGFYFCFITLSTIGLGDYVPGKSFSAPGSQDKSVFCAFYLLFGLTLLAMCFNLAQDHIRKLFKTIGINAHLLKDEEEEEN